MEQPLRLPPQFPQGELVWVAGGEIDEVCISLRFFGDDLDPYQLTQLLGSESTGSYRKGDVLRGKKYDRVMPTGSWFLSTPRSATASLDAHINSLLDCVTSDLDIWRELTQKYDSDLFCGVWLFRWNRGVDLEPETLKRMADRRLRLGLDIYYIEKKEG